MEAGRSERSADHRPHEGDAHRGRRPRLRDTDVVPHQGVAPEGAPLPELSHEALHELAHPHVDDVDGWYYEQPPFDLDWVLGPDGFDPAPGERTRATPPEKPVAPDAAPPGPAHRSRC